jgi:RND family efflux transporter MFP subunit
VSKIAERPILHRIGHFVITVCFIGAAGLAVVSGSHILTDRANAAPAADIAIAVPVSVSTITFEDHYIIQRRFLGQIEAGANAIMSFELGGRLAFVNIDEGDVVAKGDIIAQLDTDLLMAERARLQASRDATSAQLEFAQSRLTRAAELQADGFSSRDTLDQARATRDELTSRIAEIDALVVSNTINIDKSVLTAPFDGRVASRLAEDTDTLAAGQPVLTLIETGGATVRVGLPLALSTTDLEHVTININGELYPATLHRLRPDVDPVTRTRTALFRVKGDVAVTFGQTATLLIETEVAAQGTWVSLDALQQGSGSIWTVLVVQDNIVRTAAVEVLHAQSDRAYVQGTFDAQAKIIDTGAHRVVPGQQVTLMDEQG